MSIEFSKKFGEHKDYISNSFVLIFIENNAKQRLNFFKDPLVQFLWTVFRSKGRSVFREALNQIREGNQSDNQDQRQYR